MYTYQNQAAAAAFVCVYMYLNVYLSLSHSSAGYLCAPKSQFRRRGPQSEPEWPRYYSLSIMLGAGPRAQKEGDDVMGQQCHHTKRIILQKYFIASLASYWSLSADAFLLPPSSTLYSIRGHHKTRVFTQFKSKSMK